MSIGMHTSRGSKGTGLRVLLALPVALLAAALWSDVAAAAPWCGTVSTTDRPAVLGGHVIRVLYATPSDGVDRSVELDA